MRSSVLGGQVVAEFNASGARTRGYVYLGGELLAVQQNNQVSWMHQDPVAKSKRVTDGSGNVVSTLELDPWGGETTRSSNSAFQPRHFTTYERDGNASDEAMHRRYNRRYNRWHSRFDQPDPYDGSYDLTNPQSFNRFAYVQNDPVNSVDPSGLDQQDLLYTPTPGMFMPDPNGGYRWVEFPNASVTINISGGDRGIGPGGLSSGPMEIERPPVQEPTDGGGTPGLPVGQDPLDEKEIQRRLAEGKAWDTWWKWVHCNTPIMNKYNKQLQDFHKLGGEAFWLEVGAGIAVATLLVADPNPMGVWLAFLAIVGTHSLARKKVNEIISDYKNEVAEKCGPKPPHPHGLG